MIEFSEGTSTLRSNGLTGRIYADAFHPTQIKDKAIIASTETWHRMPAAAYRQIETLFPCEIHGSNHIGNVRGLNDQQWPAILHRVIDSAGLVIVVIGRINQRAAKRSRQVFQFTRVSMV
jgi:hypothetical protein